jgi:hypothetical protein
MHDDVDQLEYCYTHMLPIWERWTDGNQAVRRFLECTSADTVMHEEALRRLLDASIELSRHGDTPGIRAALAAASACCNANIGVPAEQFLVVCERAALQDRAAQWTRPTGQSS